MSLAVVKSEVSKDMHCAGIVNQFGTVGDLVRTTTTALLYVVCFRTPKRLPFGIT